MAVTFFTKPERCVVIGDAASAAHIAHKVASGHAVHASVLGHVVLERQAAGGGPVPVPMLGTIDTLGFVLVEHRVDRAIIAPDYAHPDDILDAIRFVRSLGVKVSILPRLFEVVGSSVAFDDVDGTMLLGVRAHGLSRSSRLLKHAFDKIGAVVGIVLLAPVLAAIALAIKLDSRGPVLFRQQRIGRGGRSFRIFKFRTMYVGADALKEELRHRNEAAAGLFKIADDPRITRVGRLLRRTSLDELPQLLNVLGGEMSLVGPRPLVPDEDRRVEGWQRRRLQLAPGMTGLWQIFGSSRIPLAEMVKIDYLYGANWSLWLDVKILLRTVPHALGRRGL
jgi:exopolysaccharide biosynthesis polyprenyl glycosylphosphotransferase